MDTKERIARELAAALLAGAWEPEGMIARSGTLLGAEKPWLRAALIHGLIAGTRAGYPPSIDAIARHLMAADRFDRLVAGRLQAIRARPAMPEPACFAPLERFRGLDIPHLVAEAEPADWLGLSPGRLDWFADRRHQHGRATEPKLQHYDYAAVPRRDRPPRLIEAPKPELKRIQRRILRGILDQMPVHDRAHGFVAGRSCLSAAHIHAGEAVVVALDLENFFWSIPAGRIIGLFRMLGYPAGVARLLAGLCTTTTPRPVLRDFGAAFPIHLVTRPHLAQGAPTSPALANLVAYGLDQRLAGLAASFDAHYTRYADDMMLSGGAAFAAGIDRFLAIVEQVVAESGFRLNRRKTRIMRRGGRQKILGIVVNAHCNPQRGEYDTLKATLHNCVRHGPAAENRSARPDFRAHLAGRIAWIAAINERRGRRLLGLFETIAWP
jgi:hypothetical protein